MCHLKSTTVLGGGSLGGAGSASALSGVCRTAPMRVELVAWVLNICGVGDSGQQERVPASAGTPVRVGARREGDQQLGYPAELRSVFPEILEATTYLRQRSAMIVLDRERSTSCRRVSVVCQPRLRRKLH